MKLFFNNKKNFYLTMFLILILGLHSCTKPLTQNEATPTTTLPLTVNVDSPVVASVTAHPISTQDQSTLAQDNRIIDIHRMCLFPQSLSQPFEAGSGSVVTTLSIDDPNYFLDLDTRKSFRIPFSLSDHKVYGGKISPNGKWIAFEVDHVDSNNNVIDSKLEILDAHGQQKVTVPWEKNWGVIRKWLDNEKLFIDGYGAKLGTIFIIHPFTGQVEELPSSFPNIYTDYPPAFWSLIPNSRLTLVLYLNAASPEEGVGYTLWDMATKKKLWHQDSRTAPSTPPLWSPDETQFGAIVENSITLENQADIVIINNFGHLVLETDLSSKYSYVFVGDQLSWSPDGRYLIFWLGIGSSDNPPQSTSLAILDLKEKTVTDLCIKSYGSGNNLIWTPEEQWLVTWSDEADTNILIDILENRAYLFPVPVDGTIQGWMTKPNP